jgi:hypothetical protein
MNKILLLSEESPQISYLRNLVATAVRDYAFLGDGSYQEFIDFKYTRAELLDWLDHDDSYLPLIIVEALRDPYQALEALRFLWHNHRDRINSIIICPLQLNHFHIPVFNDFISAVRQSRQRDSDYYQIVMTDYDTCPAEIGAFLDSFDKIYQHLPTARYVRPKLNSPDDELHFSA